MLNAQNIGNVTEYLAFIQKSINANLQDPVKQPKLFELIKLYQIHSHSRTCWKCKKISADFWMVKFLQME